MSKIFSFEKLIVWQDAKNLTLDIYKITKTFPKEELYGLSSQLRRASNSVNSNIAEGTARSSGKDQARFYTIAFRSLIETLNHLIVAFELEYIPKEGYDMFREKITPLAYKINALKKAIQNR